MLALALLAGLPAGGSSSLFAGAALPAASMAAPPSGPPSCSPTIPAGDGHCSRESTGHAADVTAAPDGSLYVLDRRNRAVHGLTPFAAARSVQVIPPELLSGSWEPRRIDAGPQGLFLLALSLEASRVIRLDAPGGPRLAFELPLRYNDLACLPAGDLLLSRAVQRDGPTPLPRDQRAAVQGGVDRYQVDGLLVGELPREPLAQPIGVDAAPDGRIFVINRVPVPDAPQATEPPATQEPSRGALGRERDRSAQAGWRGCRRPSRSTASCASSAAERSWRRSPSWPPKTWPPDQATPTCRGRPRSSASAAASPSGDPPARRSSYQLGATILGIAQPWTGGRRLHASLNHCHAQGVLSSTSRRRSRRRVWTAGWTIPG